jgi:hypothetical protein
MAAEAPQKSEPGRQVHWRFWHCQSEEPGPEVFSACVQEDALQ